MKMNVPKLRFKEFNDEWKKDFLNNNAIFLQGLTYKPNDVSNKGIIVLRSSNIQNSMIDYNDIVKVNIDISPKLRIRENDILMCVRNGSKNLVGKTAWLSNNEEKCTWGAFMNVIRPLKRNKFIYYYLNSNYFYNYIWKDLGTATVNQITLKTLNDCKLFLPIEEEQEKIGTFLSLLDKKIELQSKKIEALKLYKKGLFSNITYDTMQKFKLEDILQEQNEKSTVINQYDILSSTANGLFLQSDYFNKQAASENNIGYKILKRNQLVLSPQNLWMGNININDKYDIGIVSPSYKIFNINTSIVNIQYFNNLIHTPRALYEYMISSEQGASIVRRNLNMDLFNSTIIKLPPINIQNKIGKNIYLFNRLTELESNKLNKLQKLKKGLMQNMFV